MTIQQIEDAEYHYDDFPTYPDESNWSRHFTTIAAKTKQRWRIREDGDTLRTQEIVHMGQQKVKRV